MDQLSTARVNQPHEHAATGARNPRFAVVVTSISAPNPVLKALAAGCQNLNLPFFVIGDVSSPPAFELEGCRFYGMDRQASSGFSCAALLPTRHYARKNIGYLLAAKTGVEAIVETDDDNFPRAEFWSVREQRGTHGTISTPGWSNVYSYFSDARIWPRGLPLDAVGPAGMDGSKLPAKDADCPIQQGLADENPDVDAIYRLILPLPVSFRAGRSIALSQGVWCPFNSQNTTWFQTAYELLYLPSYCSFRMTDIWRSLVAQRIAWQNGWSVLFHGATVWQERNEHSLMKDFADEVPGYLYNRAIAETLAALELRAGPAHISDSLVRCYEALVRLDLIDSREIPLLEAWLSDFAEIRAANNLIASGENHPVATR